MLRLLLLLLFLIPTRSFTADRRLRRSATRPHALRRPRADATFGHRRRQQRAATRVMSSAADDAVVLENEELFWLTPDSLSIEVLASPRAVMEQFAPGVNQTIWTRVVRLFQSPSGDEEREPGAFPNGSSTSAHLGTSALPCRYAGRRRPGCRRRTPARWCKSRTTWAT
jgi:hypothetical protein